MRIKGLVRACNMVRTRLQSGLRAHEVQQFRIQVESLVEEVVEMCAQRGLTPEHLPTPSRNAYRVLKQLDLDNLPVQHAAGSSEMAAPLAISNLVRLGNHIAERLWRESTVPSAWSRERSQLLADIQKRVSDVERICLEYDSVPSALAPTSKRVYCWLKFLSSQERIELHLSALERMASALRSGRGDVHPTVRVHMVNMDSLWRARQYKDALLAKVNEGFLNADQAVCQAIVLSCLSQRDPAWDRLIREFADSDDFCEVLLEMDSFAEPVTPHAQGHVHNLGESFERVNEAHFGGSMSKPRLVWNHTLTARKFGHYQQSRDTVMLSISLDDPRVPPSLVDFVMYHELLHKKHGAVIVNGRRLVHSPQFRAEERRFPDYSEVVGSLSDLVRRYG